MGYLEKIAAVGESSGLANKRPHTHPYGSSPESGRDWGISLIWAKNIKVGESTLDKDEMDDVSLALFCFLCYSFALSVCSGRICRSFPMQPLFPHQMYWYS